MSEAVPSPLSRWFEVFKKDVLSGRVSLEDLLEVTDADMSSEMFELCPACARFPVRLGTRGGKHGVCGVCWIYHLRDVHAEKAAELEAMRSYNASKKHLQRLRDSLGVMPRVLRKDRDYVGRSAIDPASMRATDTCETCGSRFYSHAGERDCPACVDQRERREHELAERAARRGKGHVSDTR